MAYQNVGTPRFYINNFEWMHSQGIMENEEDYDIEDFFTINPKGFHEFKPLDGDGHNDYTICPKFTGIRLDNVIGKKAFIAVLGHNFATRDVIMGFYAQDGNGTSAGSGTTENVINTEFETNFYRSFQGLYDGFSIYTMSCENFIYTAGLNYGGDDDADLRLRFDSGTHDVDDASSYSGTTKIGFSSIVIGSY